MASAISDSSQACLVALFVLVAVPSSWADALSQLTPAQAARGSVETVAEVLGERWTEPDVTAFAGNLPTRCTDVPGHATICVFKLSKKQKGWRPLASALDTGDRLNLVCEFPANGDPRSEGACAVQPQRSNRNYYQARLPGLKSGSKTPKTVHQKAKAELAEEAKLILASARNAFELSALIGDAPFDCRDSGGLSREHKDEALCTWKATAASYGHGTLALTIDAPFRKKVRLGCRLPLNGSPRRPGSCTVEIGS